MMNEDALAQLTTLTAGLQPLAGASGADLVAVQTALAASLLHANATGGASGFPSVVAGAAARAELAQIIETAAKATPQTAVPLVVPRRLPIAPIANPALAKATPANVRVEAYGPFRDASGAPRWFDIVPPIKATAICRGTVGTPFIVVELSVPSGTPPTTYPLGPGSVWILARALAATAPADGYCGLAITGGALIFSAAPTVSSGALVAAASATVTLTLDFADASLPSSATFTFDAGGVSVSAASAATFAAYGTSVSLTRDASAPSYEAALGQVYVPFKPAASTFAVTTPPASGKFVPGGSAPIAWAGWMLPLTDVLVAQLGAAASAGLLALHCTGGLTAAIDGLGNVPLDDATIEVSGSTIVVTGVADSPRSLAGSLDLWPGTEPSPRSTLAYRVARGAVVYALQSADAELIAFGAALAAHIDRPLRADGSRLGPQFDGVVAAFATPSLNGALVIGALPAAEASGPPISMALRNALLVTTLPLELIITGTLAANGFALSAGTLFLAFGLEGVLPALPDPYAANLVPALRRQRVTSARLNATVSWTATTTAVLAFSEPDVTAAMIGATALPATTALTGDRDAQALAQVRAIVDDMVGGAPRLQLLDVSGNVDRFGVAFSVAATARETPAAEQMSVGSGLAVAGLDLVAPCESMRVFTVPAIAWEPVATVQNPDVVPSAFPSPAGFANDGGPTQFAAADVTLVPVAPESLLAQIVDAYDDGAAAAAYLTLPFGMVAAVAIPARATNVPILMLRPGLIDLQPGFPAASMSGGHQLSLSAAPRPFALPGSTSASSSLPGAALQLRNLIDESGTALGLSVLGPDVDVPFNGEFGPGGKSPGVPIERIDVSGYGASMSSDWVDSSAAPPAVVQAHFGTIVGRSNREVVRVKSILYPWGAIVVRTITIDRLDDGTISRHDSGWVASTAGTFDIPGFTTHPGSVTGAYNIREIKATGETVLLSGGAEVLGVSFDADIGVVNVLSGAAGGLVPSSGQFGYVQVAPIGSPLTPAQHAELLAKEGPLGGPVDCVTAIGGTAQTMRVLRVEVATAPHGGSPEFAAAARGSVVLPQPGAWSVIAQPASATDPEPIDPQRGVPLIRLGAAPSPPPNAPWRLAEPVDLWTPDAPSVDYCLVHGTDSTRIVFPRPKIEAGAHAVTSDRTPLLADGFALMNATSIVPNFATLLTFPDANFALDIDGDGAFTLAGVPASFAPSMSQRTVAQGSSGRIAYEYAEPDGTPAKVSLSLSPSAYAISLTGTNVRLDMDPYEGLMRTTGDILVDESSGARFAHSNLVLGSMLQPLQDLLGFLEELGLPNPLTLGFSNGGWTTAYKLKANLTFSLPSPLLPALTPLLQTPTWSFQLSVKLGFGNSAGSAAAMFSSSSQWSFFFQFSGNAQLVVVAPFKAGGLVAFGITYNFPAGTKPESKQLSFQFGVIVSVGGSIIPHVLELSASVSFSFELVVTFSTSTAVAIGAILAISGSGKILGGLVGLAFTATATGLLTLTSPQSVTATFDISVDITLCWFLDISFDVSAQYTKAI